MGALNTMPRGPRKPGVQELRSGWLFVERSPAKGSEQDTDEQHEAHDEREMPGNDVGEDAVGVGKSVGEEPIRKAGENGGLGTRSKPGPRGRVQPGHADPGHESRNHEEW